MSGALAKASLAKASLATASLAKASLANPDARAYRHTAAQRLHRFQDLRMRNELQTRDVRCP